MVRDRHGNNLLHLAVVHGLTRMYDLVIDLFKHLTADHPSDVPTPGLFNEQGSDFHEPILSSRENPNNPKRLRSLRPLWEDLNNDNLTPFTLCAWLGRKKMFRKLLEDRKQLQWAYGPVQCLYYPLRGLDTSFQDDEDETEEEEWMEEEEDPREDADVRAEDFPQRTKSRPRHHSGDTQDVEMGLLSNPDQKPTAMKRKQFRRIERCVHFTLPLVTLAPSSFMTSYCSFVSLLAPRRETSALKLIVDRGHVDLLMLPKVLHLLRAKWKHQLRPIFLVRMLIYFILLGLFNATTWLNANSAQERSYEDWRDWTQLSCEILLGAAVLAKLYREFREMHSEGVRSYFGGEFIPPVPLPPPPKATPSLPFAYRGTFLWMHELQAKGLRSWRMWCHC